ncbi:MAG: hypothetical protein LLG97_02920 [Deltaproteobacteria bacterium]|nr:hypothetical protein [Deltaproteobacteria bacterium]
MKKDVARLRELAQQVREIAELPIQEHNRKLWTAVNDLHMIRPVIHVRDYPLYLIQYGNELTTTVADEFLKEVELDLLLRIYEWNHLRCDRVVEPVVKCPVVYKDSGYGIEVAGGDRSDFLARGEYKGSQHFESQITCEADLAKIKHPVVEYCEEETLRRYDLLREIFGDILQVKLFGRYNFRCCPMDDIFTWMGISEGMLKLATEPELMHRAMDLYVDAAIDRIRQYERLGILSSNNGFENIGNNCVGYTSELPPPTESGIGAKITDIWGQSADQIMTCVSPAMTQEFCFGHEQKWASLFKLYSYGCCERLDNKLGLLTGSFPNIRKVSCSPFSDLESTMEQLGDRYVISFKPNSTYLAHDTAGFDYLRKEMATALELSRKYKVNLVFNMKTLISLNGDPTRLWKWCEMASDMVSNY